MLNVTYWTGIMKIAKVNNICNNERKHIMTTFNTFDTRFYKGYNYSLCAMQI